MSRFPALVGAVVILGAACTASLATSSRSDHAQGDASPDLVCELHLTESAGQVHLRAQATSPAARSGTYRLEVLHRGSGGQSQIKQGGEFDLRAGETTTLGEASFSGTARQISADLTLQSGALTRRCSKAAL